MNIAIDYDLTYDRDPELWESFIKLAESRGHKVWCVTKREPELPVPLTIPVIYTSRKAKLDIVRAHRIEIEIWIDDNVLGILVDDEGAL